MGLQKIHNKSRVWHKHGKHRSVLMEIRKLKEPRKRFIEMFTSVHELMVNWRHRKGHV